MTETLQTDTRIAGTLAGAVLGLAVAAALGWLIYASTEFWAYNSPQSWMSLSTATSPTGGNSARSRLRPTGVWPSRRADLSRIVMTLAERYPVRRIILFGSLVRGGFAPGSDIDLAVEGLPPADYFAALAEVNRATPFWVDMKPLEDLQPRFRERVVGTEEYLAFRHVVRNIYGFELEAERIDRLTAGYPEVWRRVEADLSHFIVWLRSLVAQMDEPSLPLLPSEGN